MEISSEQIRLSVATDSRAPTLVCAWGNPSRGDDALGIRFAEALLAEPPDDVEILTDYQLQIEYVPDMENRARVLFVDAAASGPAPYAFAPLLPARDQSYSSHALSPQALLHIYQQVNRRAPPSAFLLSIRGYQFTLGMPLSEQAAGNLAMAVAFARDELVRQSA